MVATSRWATSRRMSNSRGATWLRKTYSRALASSSSVNGLILSSLATSSSSWSSRSSVSSNARYGHLDRFVPVLAGRLHRYASLASADGGKSVAILVHEDMGDDVEPRSRVEALARPVHVVVFSC